MNIADWLEQLGLGQYAQAFAENEITADVLRTLTDSDLRELGVTALGHRKKMLAEIAKLASAPEKQAPEMPAEHGRPARELRRPAGPLTPALERVEPTKAVAAPVGETPKDTGGTPMLRGEAAAPPAPTRPEVAFHRAASPVVAPPQITISTPAVKRPGFWARLIASKFLFISIVAHLLFGLGATYFIVQRIQAKRKVTFQGGPPSANPSKRALEHKVSMAQKKKTGGAPPQAKRIVTAGLAKISLPDLPTISTASTVVPGMMAGMGGAGFGTGVGFGSGMGSGMGGGGGGGGGFSFFGFRGAAANVVFVIDISGSMVQGKKDRASYDRLEKEALTALDGLSAGSRFNIITFAGQPFVYASEMAIASLSEKEKATAWMKSYSPCNVLPDGVDKGNGRLWQSGKGVRHAGTSSRKALERAFELRPGMIVFVSDGEPTDARPNDILADIAEWQKKLGTRATINAFAYKADGGDDFMEKLATQNGGTFKNIK